jgi:hypothetical protein
MNSHNNSRKTSTPVFKSTRLLDQLREQIRYLHYSLRTKEAYVYWVKKFIYFHQKQHPRDMGQAQVEAFLTHMAVERKVSVSTHRQALSALLFLYQKVLGIELPWMGSTNCWHRCSMAVPSSPLDALQALGVQLVRSYSCYLFSSWFRHILLA